MFLFYQLTIRKAPPNPMTILFSHRYHGFPQISLLTKKYLQSVGDSPFYFFYLLNSATIATIRPKASLQAIFEVTDTLMNPSLNCHSLRKTADFADVFSSTEAVFIYHRMKRM